MVNEGCETSNINHLTSHIKHQTSNNIDMNNLNAIDILIVEDNPQDAELTIRALKKNNLVNNLIVVDDGAEALDFVFCRNKFSKRDPSYPPKVILLDLKLPKVNGLEVLKILKSDALTHTIPIVIVTSSRQDPDIREAYRLGVNSYVVKPVNFDQFFEAVSKLSLYWLLINEPLR
jgi:two-component system response regulator